MLLSKNPDLPPGRILTDRCYHSFVFLSSVYPWRKDKNAEEVEADKIACIGQSIRMQIVSA